MKPLPYALLLLLAAAPCLLPAQNPDGYIRITGGKYPFGGDDGKKTVNITLSDFYLSPTEVSYAQMAMYALDNGIDPQTFHDKGWGEPDGERVAVNVNWFDAIRYANWLSEQQGYAPVYRLYRKVRTESGQTQWLALKPTDPDSVYWKGEYADEGEIGLDSIAWDRAGKGYRLPTEAEWEYAASGYAQLGRKQQWAGTDEADSLKYYARYGTNADRAEKIKSRKPNPLGLYDMSGNVWEWCFDVYDSSYKNFENQKNPTNTEYKNLRSSDRCLRGGSWYGDDYLCRVLVRNGNVPRNRNGLSGFRLARTP